MDTLHFSIFINAPVSKVWNTMLGKESYKAWTSAFNSGSTYEGSWDKGSEIKFLAPEEDGTSSGLIGKIVENRPNEYISIEYISAIYKGKSMDGWAGTHENYTFTEKDGGTEVKVELDVTDDAKVDMEEGWPKALEKLKELSEA